MSINLTDSDMDKLADKIAARLMKKESKTKAYTPKQVAEKLGISYTSIRSRIRSGKIRLIPDIGIRRIAQSELDRLLNL